MGRFQLRILYGTVINLIRRDRVMRFFVVFLFFFFPPQDTNKPSKLHKTLCLKENMQLKYDCNAYFLMKISDVS